MNYLDNYLIPLEIGNKYEGYFDSLGGFYCIGKGITAIGTLIKTKRNKLFILTDIKRKDKDSFKCYPIDKFIIRDNHTTLKPISW